MYNASGNYAEILGPSNKAAPMTDAELKLWESVQQSCHQVPRTRINIRSVIIGSNWRPTRAINFGVWTYEKSYDLESSGTIPAKDLSLRRARRRGRNKVHRPANRLFGTG